WKLRLDNPDIPLTRFRDEKLEDAAVGFVMNIDKLPLTLPGEPVDKERLKQLEEEVRKRTPIFCWMKLYMEAVR
ncbi:MAG: hypothetical protein GY765_01075, partial [bacterium]|nr:hypothetical protein [bacterium]